MIECDPFGQWIDVPDDRPALPPVDEDVSGLRDFSSLGIPTDLHIDQGGGLLLGPDVAYHHLGMDTFHAIALSPNSGQSASLPTFDSSPSYATLFPPALSPDSSPISVASTPWLRTPETDPSFVNVAGLTPVDALWVIGETEGESCSTIHFIDQSGNSLEDIPSQIQDVRQEDIACTPQVISNTSLPPVLTATPRLPLSNIPAFVTSLPGASASYQTKAALLEQTHRTSLPPSSPYISQSLFRFSPYLRETQLPGCSLSPSLSPLTTVSIFSQSPNASPNASPLVNCSPLSPALSTMPLSNSHEKVEVADSVSSTLTGSTSLKLRAKRNADTLDEGAPLCKIRRSKATNIDEEEWSPGSKRAKCTRALSSSQSTREMMTLVPDCPPDDSSDSSPSQGSAEHSDATHTTCQLCGQGFTRSSDYIRHIQNSASHPETRKVWPCPYCDKALGRKDALGRHIKTLHPGMLVLIPEGTPGNQLPEGQKGPFVQRMGQRKMSSRRQLRKDGTRRYR